MITTIVITGASLMFSGTCIGIGFAASKVVLDKLTRVGGCIKGAIYRVADRVFQSVAKWKYQMGKDEYSRLIVATATG